MPRLKNSSATPAPCALSLKAAPAPPSNPSATTLRHQKFSRHLKSSAPLRYSEKSSAASPPSPLPVGRGLERGLNLSKRNHYEILLCLICRVRAHYRFFN